MQRQGFHWHAGLALRWAPARQRGTPEAECSAPGALLGGRVGERLVADGAAAQLGVLVQGEGRVAGDALAGVHHRERDLALCAVHVGLIDRALALRRAPTWSGLRYV